MIMFRLRVVFVLPHCPKCVGAVTYIYTRKYIQQLFIEKKVNFLTPTSFWYIHCANACSRRTEPLVRKRKHDEPRPQFSPRP